MIVCDVRAIQQSCLHEALLWQPLASGQEASVDGGDNDSRHLQQKLSLDIIEF